MIPSRPLYGLTLASLGWLMMRVGIGLLLVGLNLLYEGNRWAVLLILPAVGGGALGVLAIASAVAVLAGPRLGR